MARLLLILVLSGCDGTPPPCGSDLAESDGLRVLSGSEVVGRRVSPGDVAACEGAAASVFVALRAARARLPAWLHRPVDVHLDPSTGPEPRIAFVEAHLASASLLVASRGAGELDESVWVHELAHVAAAGARPNDPIGRRLIDAIDEGVADYAAASILGRTQIGPACGTGARDLAHAEPLGPDAFHALAIPARGWEPHRFGLPFAKVLTERESEAGPLLADLVTALSDETAWPDSEGAGPTLRTLLDRTPERSRNTVADVIAHWLPPELRP